MNTPHTPRITVAFGDGIGPEIMKATLKILTSAGARFEIEPIEIGESVYRAGHSAGIAPESWDILARNKIFLKAPITTPQGGGIKSLNVTIRKTLGLFANVRPSVAYSPFVATKHPNMNLVIVRENEEDLYAGIEHRQTDEVYQCLKLISRPGCEKIIRYAFEYAVKHGRKKVTCFSKDNIMKMTDGLFHKVFDEIGAEYPAIQKDHWIVDIGAAKIADTPEIFDVVVMPNLYGDILSDVAAEIAGSVGMAGSANIGDGVAMFEAIHGSAPAIAGMDRANPSGLLNAAIQMLIHLGQGDVAARVENAWLKTLEDGQHTADIYTDGVSKAQLGTMAFADAVIARLGEVPKVLKPVSYAASSPIEIPAPRRRVSVKELDGVDVFLHERERNPDQLARRLQRASIASKTGLELQVITNRGVKVWPEGRNETFCTDHWRCRFLFAAGSKPGNDALWTLLKSLTTEGVDVVKTENLYRFDGDRGYSLAQGQ